MSRIPLKKGDIVTSSKEEYVVQSVIGDGATGIVYDAIYYDSIGQSHAIRLKECYPFAAKVTRVETELHWENEQEKERNFNNFTAAYYKLMKRQNSNFAVRVFDLFETNGTTYIVMDANDGVTFDKDNAASLGEILKTVKLLAYVVGEYHKNGYLHLDIKPSNFLVYTRPSEHIVLFDIDSVTAIADIREGKVQAVSYSKGWAPPEQMQGRLEKICPATDIFAIGAVLFEKVMGRAVENSDIGIFAHWDFESHLFEKVNPKIKRILRGIFQKTLSANIKRRYQFIDELMVDLEEAILVSTSKQYIISSYPPSEIVFVGRENDLKMLHSKFLAGTEAIFLHGFGGNGKTELAKKYVEYYASEYDCILFKKYDSEASSLAQIIQEIKIVNEDKEEDHYAQLEKICDESRILLIVDNFDTEGDEDIELLLSLNIQVLFTTRNDFSEYFQSNENIYIHELEVLSTEELIEVFENEYKKTLSEDERADVSKIIECFDNLTYAVPIIAKQIAFKGLTINEYLEKVQGDGLSLSEDDDNIRIRINGKFMKKTPMDLYRYLYNISVLTDKQVCVLTNLFCLKEHIKLSKEKYKLYTGEKNLNALNDLIFLNWVQYNQAEDKVSLHPIIEELIEADIELSPTTVPGLYSYICAQFEKLEKYNKIEDAESFSYVLLLYGHLCEADDNKTLLLQKLGDFITKFDILNYKNIYSILFEESMESTWYPLASWWIPRIHIAKQEQIHVPEKREDMDELSEQESGLLLTNSLKQLKLMVFKLAYVVENGGTLQESDFISIDINSESVLMFLPILTLYAGLGAPIEFDIHGDIVHDSVWCIGKSNPLTYAYYAYMISSIQKTIQVLVDSGITDDEDLELEYEDAGLSNKFYLIKTERLCELLAHLIIQVENSLGRFCFYDIPLFLEYKPLSQEEYNVRFEEYTKMHWSKKAKLWYNSLEGVLASTVFPVSIYKLLLTWEYHEKYLQASQTKELVKNNIVERIISDERLDDDVTTTLLLNYVANQLGGKIDHISKLRDREKFTDKHKHLLSIYAKAHSIAFSDLVLDELDLTSMDSMMDFYRSLVMMYNLLGMEFYDFKRHLLNDIKAANAKYFNDFLWMASIIKRSGDKKTSRKLKLKILDETLKIDWRLLLDEDIQIFDYFIKPVAKKYGRQDVVQFIEQENQSFDRAYHIALINNERIPEKDRRLLFKRFYNDCIDSVGRYYYHYFNNEESQFPDEFISRLKLLEGKVQVDENGYWGGVVPMYVDISFKDLLEGKTLLDIESILWKFDLSFEATEGYYFKALKDANITYWEQLEEEYFYDLTEGEDYTNERRIAFKKTLLNLRPDCKRIIEKLL